MMDALDLAARLDMAARLLRPDAGEKVVVLDAQEGLWLIDHLNEAVRHLRAEITNNQTTTGDT